MKPTLMEVNKSFLLAYYNFFAEGYFYFPFLFWFIFFYDTGNHRGNLYVLFLPPLLAEAK